MLLSQRMEELIAELKLHYDYIIIDSTPAMAVADAIITDRLADLSIYVVREGLLDRRQLPDIERLYRERNSITWPSSSTEPARQTSRVRLWLRLWLRVRPRRRGNHDKEGFLGQIMRMDT